MIRITTTTAGPLTTIKIEGTLVSEGVAELDEACRSVDGDFAIDLSELMKADEEGTRALKKLRDGGVRMVAASPYIELLMKTEV